MAYSGDTLKSPSFSKKHFTLTITGQTVLYSAAVAGMNELWYKDYPGSSFHFFDDNKEWLQMDKIAHTYSSYHLSNICFNTFTWSGLDKNKSLLLGSGLGFLYISTVEVFDGFSKQWGASTGDIAANSLGVALFCGQQYFWDEQKITLKYSYRKSGVVKYRPETFGKNFSEQLIKDYNGMTFWLSLNINSVYKIKYIPDWLNISFGYGADGMLAGNSNDEVQIDGVNPERKRRYFFSIDVDFTRIKTKYKVLSTIFKVINIIKVPFPAVEYSKRSFTLHPLYF
ncbi:MAG: DUF2279 domain-containing protein [Bacteroidia bacterium]|nr:DUF2279 domain-containing protein [Bacteroidia bacterium]